MSVTAQTAFEELDYNNSRVDLLNGGDFFWNLKNSKYEVPKSEKGSTPKTNIINAGL